MPTIAKESDRDAVVATIVAAFRDDPTWAWMFPDPRRRAEQHGTIFGMYVDSALPEGGVWMSDDRASAVAVFNHPEGHELSEQSEARPDPVLNQSLGHPPPADPAGLHGPQAAIPPGAFYYL